tara:strand:- start:147510 stop:148076 length:567 start_codon:yes stop_codon:yes gene_type:complete
MQTSLEGHLTIAPFVMTTASFRDDGTSRGGRIIRGNAEGVISVEEDGITKDVLRVTSDGVFTRLDGKSGSLRLDKGGTFHIDGKAFTKMRIGDDGTMYGGEEVVAKIEDGKVVDVIGGFLTSTVTSNGETQTTTKAEITIEGGPDAQRLAGAMLGLMLLPGDEEVSDDSYEKASEPAVAPEAVPASTP